MKSDDFPALLEAFFTERLVRQRQASAHTIASYRDTFSLFLSFVRDRLKKAPTALTLPDIDAPLVGAFLDHLEKDRRNTARSRNLRLAAIHSFFRYAVFHQPQHSASIQRILSIPSKRFPCKPIDFLSAGEVDAVLAAPDQTTWFGRRDRTLLLVAVQTGLRVSEVIGLRCQDVVLGVGAHLRCCGKGRKERCTPLRKDAAAALRAWLRERAGHAADPCFPNGRGGPLSRDAVEYLLAKYSTAAARRCATLKRKRVSPHVLRHTAAMDLLQHGVDRSVIALWLGHESVETTQMYLHADLRLKEKALAKTSPTNGRLTRYRPDDRLLSFLKSL
jgi:site-specific recombinase XerD